MLEALATLNAAARRVVAWAPLSRGRFNVRVDTASRHCPVETTRPVKASSCPRGNSFQKERRMYVVVHVFDVLKVLVSMAASLQLWQHRRLELQTNCI